MRTVICYKTNTQLYGVDEFLAYYTYKNIDEAKKEVEEINKNHPATLWNGQKIDWDNVKFFFVDRQELMV